MGSTRMRVDYKARDNFTVKSTCPLPRIYDLLDKAMEACVVSSLDLQSRYHQIRLVDEDVVSCVAIWG